MVEANRRANVDETILRAYALEMWRCRDMTRPAFKVLHDHGTLLIGVLVVTGAMVMPTCAFAQGTQFGTTTNRGNTGATTTSSMFGQTAFGGLATLGTTGQASGANSMGMGTTGMPTGMTSGLGTTGFATSTQPGGFVGASSQNTTNVRSMQGTGALGAATALGGRGATNGLQGLFSQIGRSLQNSFNTQQGQRGLTQRGQGTQTQIRIPLRVGFQQQTVVPARFSAKLSERFTRLPALQRLGPIEVLMEGRTAVLRGNVATEADRELAQGLAMLEPEVLQVRNELVVGTPEAAAEELAPAPAARSP
jgi:hypothetical protein